jgi:hypothetical protein
MKKIVITREYPSSEEIFMAKSIMPQMENIAEKEKYQQDPKTRLVIFVS